MSLDSHSFMENRKTGVSCSPQNKWGGLQGTSHRVSLCFLWYLKDFVTPESFAPQKESLVEGNLICWLHKLKQLAFASASVWQLEGSQVAASWGTDMNPPKVSMGSLKRNPTQGDVKYTTFSEHGDLRELWAAGQDDTMGGTIWNLNRSNLVQSIISKREKWQWLRCHPYHNSATFKATTCTGD